MLDIDRWKESYPSLTLSEEQTLFWLTSVEELPQDYWDKQKDALQNRAWLQALESSDFEGFEFGLLAVVTNGEITAHCMVQLTDLPFSLLSSYIPSWLQPILQKVPHFTSSREGEQRIRAMVAGDLMITASQSKTAYLPLFVQGLTWLESWMSAERGTFLQVFKDISIDDTEDLSLFCDHGYSQCFSEPEMVLELKEEWINIDDYVQALNKKYRQRYRNTRKKGRDLITHNLELGELTARQSELQVLLNNVLQRSQFSLVEENIEFYIQCAELMGASFQFKLYELNGKAVGFSTSIERKEALVSHRVGLDYEINTSHKLYQNILYDYIEQAIKLRRRSLSFGRTALEIKSAVGAEPRQLQVLMKYPLWLPNLFLRAALSSIPEPEWTWRNALKKPSSLATRQKSSLLDCTFQRWLSGCT